MKATRFIAEENQSFRKEKSEPFELTWPLLSMAYRCLECNEARDVVGITLWEPPDTRIIVSLT